MRNKLLVIGGASSDILHTINGTVASAGGAGMYTAMAAWRCGSLVTLYAPKPSPIPDALLPVAVRLTEWLGPVIRPENLAHFEISYLDGHTTYLQASTGAETELSPEGLPDDLSQYDCIHVIPLGSPLLQLEFIRTCKQRGARRISAGNHFEHIAKEPDLVRRILDSADFCFMNEKEAIGLFGSLDQAHTEPGKVLFVTLGSKGCLVIQGEYSTRLGTVPTTPKDPTGAGDTFCGAVLSRLITGLHPIMAASAAMPLAAEMIQHTGPAALLWKEDPPGIPESKLVKINAAQVERAAGMIARLPEVQPSNFIGPEYPPAGHPAALDFFFASTLQQFGFWSIQDHHYHQPLVAPIYGAPQKGSTYLFYAYLRMMEKDPGFFHPAHQAKVSEEEIRKLFQADDGCDPMPELDLHLSQARQYGKDMLALGLNPSKILREAKNSGTPLKTFLELLDTVGGYKEDPLRKKANLLAMILNQRPEKFLTFGEDETLEPIIDYHLMRSCLRTGVLEVQDSALREKLEKRQVLSAGDEWEVRWAAYQAIQEIVEYSGKSTGAVDWFFFNARRRCPEMSDPVCVECPIDSICAHYKELFQPVLRTVFY